MLGWLIGGNLSTEAELFVSSGATHEMVKAEAKQDMISFI